MIEEVEEGEMPLDSYTWMHGNITETEKEALLTLAAKAHEKYKVN